MNKIIINGEEFFTTGKNIRVNNNKVIVNGNIIKEGLQGDVHVIFEGELANLDCTTATINGDVRGSVDGTTINVQGDVGGDIDGTTINIGGNVQGNVDGTTINCGDVQGNVDAMKITRK